jgi:hypothetical protein
MATQCQSLIGFVYTLPPLAEGAPLYSLQGLRGPRLLTWDFSGEKDRGQSASCLKSDRIYGYSAEMEGCGKSEGYDGCESTS